jgi:hypothetical protein
MPPAASRWAWVGRIASYGVQPGSLVGEVAGHVQQDSDVSLQQRRALSARRPSWSGRAAARTGSQERDLHCVTTESREFQGTNEIDCNPIMVGPMALSRS